jgi:hypothetical protein
MPLRGNKGRPAHAGGEKVSAFSNKLSAGQLERLAILAEELGEAQQVIGKIIRHGYDSGNPLEAYVANETLLEKELGHVKFAMGMLWREGDISEARTIEACDAKGNSIKRWLHHQSQPAAPTPEKERGKP